MSEQNAITERKVVSLSSYGDRDDVKELAERIKMMMPNGLRYNDVEALTLAQIGIAHNLDPFNGEVWLIKGNDGKVYGALVGIKGHRKLAKKQAIYWGEFVRIVDVAKYDANDKSIVFEYRIYDDKTLGSHQVLLERYIKLGMSLKDALDVIGRPPHTLGIGIWSPGDQTKMKPVQCAMFRAEKDALKRRFDVNFRIELKEGIVPMSATSGEEDEIEQEEIEAEYESVEPENEDQLLEELGFPPEQPPAPTKSAAKPRETKPTEDPRVAALIDAKVVQFENEAEVVLGKLKLADSLPIEEVVKIVRGFYGWKELGSSDKQAIEYLSKGDYPK
jgi:hypothetical protein